MELQEKEQLKAYMQAVQKEPNDKRYCLILDFKPSQRA